MELLKSYQLEKYDIAANEIHPMLDTLEIESWDDGACNITIYGHDGNIMLETTGEKIQNDEYPEWSKPIFEELRLI